MPVLRLPEGLRRYAGEQDSLPVAGRTLGEVLAAAVAAYPGLQIRLLGEDGRLRRYLLVFRNEAHLPRAGLEETPLAGDDVVTILEAVGGGA